MLLKNILQKAKDLEDELYNISGCFLINLSKTKVFKLYTSKVLTSNFHLSIAQAQQ